MLPPGPGSQAESVGQRTSVFPLEAKIVERTSWLMVTAPMSLTNACGADQPMIGPLMKL